MEAQGPRHPRHHRRALHGHVPGAVRLLPPHAGRAQHRAQAGRRGRGQDVGQAGARQHQPLPHAAGGGLVRGGRPQGARRAGQHGPHALGGRLRQRGGVPRRGGPDEAADGGLRQVHGRQPDPPGRLPRREEDGGRDRVHGAEPVQRAAGSRGHVYHRRHGEYTDGLSGREAEGV